MNILLSLIIPVYKVEAFIYQCLNSIFSQITENNSIELIIVNDGSPDNSMSIVEELTKDKPHITIVNQQNQGLSVARNTGLSHAKGEYVWFIDSDDWLLPNAIEDVLNYIGISCFNPETDIDYAIEKIDDVNAFLRQDVDAKFDFEETLHMMEGLFE